MKFVIAGGTGSLGRRLCRRLVDQGHEVVVLTRRLGPSAYHQVLWDGCSQGAWSTHLSSSIVVNLAGELVDRRPTDRNIRLLTASRVEPTLALVQAAATLRSPPLYWIQASTLAIYGDAGEQLLTEESETALGPPQMAGVARAWEEAAAQFDQPKMTILRTSIVLDAGTPALERLRRLVRAGLGGPVGSGEQWFSWIHIEDWLRIIDFVADRAQRGREEDLTNSMSGVLLATSPNPVRNHELMSALRRTSGQRIAIATPDPVVRLGAWALGSDASLALTSRRATPARLTAEGFSFSYPAVGQALTDLLPGHSM